MIRFILVRMLCYDLFFCVSLCRHHFDEGREFSVLFLVDGCHLLEVTGKHLPCCWALILHHLAEPSVLHQLRCHDAFAFIGDALLRVQSGYNRLVTLRLFLESLFEVVVLFQEPGVHHGEDSVPHYCGVTRFLLNRRLRLGLIRGALSHGSLAETGLDARAIASGGASTISTVAEVSSVADRGSIVHGVAVGCCRRSELRNERWRRLSVRWYSSNGIE